MDSMEEYYNGYKSIGFSHEASRIRAFIDKNRIDEATRVEDEGLDYTPERVRVSIVHGREDIALTVLYLGNIASAVEGTKHRLGIIIVLLIAFLFFLIRR